MPSTGRCLTRAIARHGCQTQRHERVERLGLHVLNGKFFLLDMFFVNFAQYEPIPTKWCSWPGDSLARFRHCRYKTFELLLTHSLLGGKNDNNDSPCKAVDTLGIHCRNRSTDRRFKQLEDGRAIMLSPSQSQTKVTRPCGWDAD